MINRGHGNVSFFLLANLFPVSRMYFVCPITKTDPAVGKNWGRVYISLFANHLLHQYFQAQLTRARWVTSDENRLIRSLHVAHGNTALSSQDW